MAFYDNKYWLLTHIRNSFMASDDTGNCELVMQGENLTRRLERTSRFDCYPGDDDSDDDLDGMGQSIDLESDLEFGVRRERSNTAAQLQKLHLERKRNAKIKHVKWEGKPSVLSSEDMANLFPVKDLTEKAQSVVNKPRRSLLAVQLSECSQEPQNPFEQYEKYDGNSQVGYAVKKIQIFLPMLSSSARNYPLSVVVVSSAKIKDLIGLICYKCTIQHPNHAWSDKVENYNLHIAEDNGEIDWDFPCLDPQVPVGKFGFQYLALVEVSISASTQQTSDTNGGQSSSTDLFYKAKSGDGKLTNKFSSLPTAESNAYQSCIKEQIRAIQAPLYESYRVFAIHPLRARTEVNLGISGDKVEIDPTTQEKVTAKFWMRQKAVSFDTDCIVSCRILGIKGNKSTFRLVYYRSLNQFPGYSSSLQSTNFKHQDFEASLEIAKEVVDKINNILELRCSVLRKQYLEIRESKTN